MNREIWGIIIQVAIMIALSYPLGKYIAKVYKGEKNCLDFLSPFENWIYKLCSINPREDMTWKRFVVVLLLSNLVWFVFGLLLLLFQGGLPLNPDHNPNMPFWLAVNTCISFLVNCNLQHYAGETSLTYLTQLLVVMLFQFVTAATGMAAFAGLLRGMSQKCSNAVGNFWVYLVKSVTRILLPLSLVVGIVLAIDGVPMTLQGKQTIATVEGGTQTISQGPVAAVVAIKQLGTNGGGFFAANSAHPLENPSYFSNMVEDISIILIPMALVWCLGFYLDRKKFAFWIFVIMLGGYLTSTAISVQQEMSGSPKIAAMGISQPYGNMEGKETRFGSGATALWAMTTTSTSNGSVNGMQDSMTPISTLFSLINMQVNCWFGGVGVGFMNYYIFIIIAVFISGLMVGRTPEFLGKKIEAPQMKVATLVALLHPFLILAGTALAACCTSSSPKIFFNCGNWH